MLPEITIKIKLIYKNNVDEMYELKNNYKTQFYFVVF